MRADLVLWVYIVLLVVGGLIGFLKAGSKMSLLTAVSSAAVLSLCASGAILQRQAANVFVNIILATLLVLFGWRLAKSKKFVPSGLMLVLTLAALVLRNARF